MGPCYLNFPPGFQAPGDAGWDQPAQSNTRDPRVPPSLHAPTSGYFSAPSPQSYSFLGEDSRGAFQMPPQAHGTNPARSLRPSVGSGSIRPPSLLSSDPYQQARLRHIADRASAQHQGWSHPSLPMVPAPTLPLGASAPYGMEISNLTSTPFPVTGSVSQLNIVPSGVTQNLNVPYLMHNFTNPGQMDPSASQAPAPTSCKADQADIEYARYRYGDTRCFYQCRFDLLGSPCHKWIVGDRTRVLRHLRNHHRLQLGPAAPALCLWDECTHSRPMKQENLSRHVVRHLGVKWKCRHCKRLFSRDDAVHRHMERMAPGMDATDAEVVPGREAHAITESQSKRARNT